MYHQHTHTNVHSGFICNSRNLEIMQMPSTGEWIYILVYSYSGILLFSNELYKYMSELFTYYKLDESQSN